MTYESSSIAGGERMWWLSTADKPEGPFSESSVIERLRANQLSATALACPVGGQQWKTISEWPNFASLVVAPPGVTTTPIPVASTSDSPVTNPLLPSFANWICVYTLAILPVYWLASRLSCVMTGFTLKEDSDLFGLEVLGYLVDFIISLAICVVMFLGGLFLRSLRKIGPTLLKIGIWIGLAYSLLSVPLALLIFAAAGEEAFAETSPAGDVISYFLMIAGLLTLAFEIVALIWLLRNSHLLPLRDK